MKFLTKILKGGLIGIAAVIPGFSGGTIACIMGCYDEIITAVSNIRKEFKKSLITLLPYVLGIILFAVAAYFPIKWGIDNYPFITVSLFAGLLLGGIPSFSQNLKGGGKDKINLLFALIGGAVILAIVIPSLFATSNVNIVNASTGSPYWYMFILLFIMGVIASCALVVPGISGSMVLLVLGFYNPILELVGSLANNILNRNIIDVTDPLIANLSIFSSFFLLVLFALGILFGFVLISKIMKYLLEHHRLRTYYAIFGFIVMSFIGIYLTEEVMANYQAGMHPVHVVIAILLLAVGFACSFILGRMAEKK